MPDKFLPVPATINPYGKPALPELSQGPYSSFWIGETEAKRKNAEFIRADADLLAARRAQAQAMSDLVDTRVGLANKIAGLQAHLHEHALQLEQKSWLAHHTRARERMQTELDVEIARARLEAELAKAREIKARSERNQDAAERISQSQVDQWWAEQEARKANALAEHQDAIADLTRAPVAGGATPSRQDGSSALVILEHQLEIERQRGNTEGVSTLQNAIARIKAS